MKFFIVLSLIFSCSHKESLEHSKTSTNPWILIEGATNELTYERAIQNLGAPSSVETHNGTKTLYYLNKTTKLQSWKIDFDSQRKMTTAIYFPTADGAVFNIKFLQERWSKKNCITEKTKTLILTHSHSIAGKMSCESGKYIVSFDSNNQIQEVEAR
jgi:hypothetical protein